MTIEKRSEPGRCKMGQTGCLSSRPRDKALWRFQLTLFRTFMKGLLVAIEWLEVAPAGCGELVCVLDGLVAQFNQNAVPSPHASPMIRSGHSDVQVAGDQAILPPSTSYNLSQPTIITSFSN